MKIDIISVQPKMFSGFLTESIVARAVAKGACSITRTISAVRWTTDPTAAAPG